MKIHLPPELKKMVNEELKVGHFPHCEEVIAEALQLCAKKKKSSPSSRIRLKGRRSAKLLISLRKTGCASMCVSEKN